VYPLKASSNTKVSTRGALRYQKSYQVECDIGDYVIDENGVLKMVTNLFRDYINQREPKMGQPRNKGRAGKSRRHIERESSDYEVFSNHLALFRAP
jgi:hypothetical protein